MLTFADQQTKTANPTAGFVAVKIESLRRLRSAAIDLFVQYDVGGPPMLYHRAGCAVDSSHWSTLADAGIRHVFVRFCDLQALGRDMLEAVQSVLETDSVTQAERFAAVQLAFAFELERTFRLAESGPYVQLAEHVAKDLTDLLAANSVLPNDLFRLARHDFNTFTHVTNVTSYTVILAERMGACARDELNLIATGAMLHDLGKRHIPANILTKPARLEPAERAIIETHPQRGYEDLCRRPDVTFDQLMMVYQHHERIDGRGYPVGIIGEEIHPWAKILTVVDVFDAMTGTRPYRRPATAHEAIQFIQQNAGTQFDREAAQCWSALTAT